MAPIRVDVVLKDEDAESLRLLAERTGASPESVAQALLARALDDARLDGAMASFLLDRIPGALDAVREGERDALDGRTVRLDRL